MGKRVYLAEKPKQGKAIGRAFGASGGGQYHIDIPGGIIVWSLGHLLGDAKPGEYDDKWKSWTIEALPIDPHEWKLVEPEDPKLRKLIRTAIKAVKDADEIVICTDAGREGEFIAHNIIETAGAGSKPQWRLWTESLDPAELRRQLSRLKPGHETKPKAWAGEVRSRLDYLEGMNFTRVLTLKCVPARMKAPPLAVGRVQTPTLGLIVRREREIRQFKPETRFYLKGIVESGGFAIPMEHRPKNNHVSKRDEMEGRAKRATGAQGPLKVERSGEKRRGPNAPYNLVAIQAVMNVRRGWTLHHTLEIAQKLYEERGAMSYPRTESKAYLESEWDLVAKTTRSLAKLGGEYARMLENLDEPLKRRNVWNDRHVTDHGALRPTEGPFDAGQWTGDERILFDEVTRNYISQLYPDWRYEETNVSFDANSVLFTVRGVKTLHEGWRTVVRAESETTEDGEKKEREEHAIEVPANGTPAHMPRTPEVKSYVTKPPPRYTEGAIAKRMEKLQLGTSATYPATIEKLKKYEYVDLQKKQLVATEVGEALVTMVEEHVPALAEPETTKLLEQELLKIERRETTPEEVLSRLKRNTFENLDRLIHAELPMMPVKARTQEVSRGRTGQRRRTSKTRSRRRIA